MDSDTPASPPPVACALDAGDARAQVGEWRDLLAARPNSTRRRTATELLVRIEPDQVPEAVGLAQREVACCPFFGFSLQIEADALVLHITVPDDASEVLDALDAERTARHEPDRHAT